MSIRSKEAAIPVVLLACSTIVHAGAAPPDYTVTVLLDPPSSAAVSPSAINESGQATGPMFNLATGYFDGVMWDADGSPTILSTAYGLDAAEGIGIHDDGTILAAAAIDAVAEVQHGAILAPDGTFIILPSLAGDSGVVSAAFDMNDAGIIAGRSALVPTPFWLSVPNDAVIWQDGVITSIGTLGGFFATGRHINNNNVIIGESNTASSDFARGFVWTERDGMREIPPLEPGEFGHVRDLNDSDVIVGRATLGSSVFACIWTAYEPPTLLETLPGDGNSATGGINDAGDIVGSASTPEGTRARLWMNGEVYDLNDLLAEPLGYPLVGTIDITNSGLILARGDDPSRPGFNSVLLKPVICPADLDGSGAVDFNDLLALLVAWGPCPGCPADLDGSGAVDFSDLLQLLVAWGPC